MAVWSEVSFREAHDHNRFSAEYWRPEYLEPLRKSLPWQPLGDALKKVQYGISREMNEESLGVPCFRMNEMDTIFLSHPQKSMVVTGDEKRQFMLRKGDVLFNRTNSLKFVGRTGYCDQTTEAVFASYLIRLLPDKAHLLPEFLAVYLNTSVGIGQVKRRAMESINQANVSGSEVKLVPIPLFDIEFQKRIADFVHSASEQRHAAACAYAEAESLLESALGLDELDLTPQLFYKRQYAEVEEAGRFDAEYFNPRTQNIIEALSRDGFSIADLAILAKRKFHLEAGSEFQYIAIADVIDNGTVDSNPVLGEEAPSRATRLVEPGDVITTTVRPIRRLSAIITDEQNGYVCSSGFAVLTPEEIEPELLLVYLRLPLVCELMDLHTTASMYPAISTTELMKIPISLPDDATREQIVTKVRESFDARREARRLLEEAKTMVEKAILDD